MSRLTPVSPSVSSPYRPIDVSLPAVGVQQGVPIDAFEGVRRGGTPPEARPYPRAPLLGAFAVPGVERESGVPPVNPGPILVWNALYRRFYQSPTDANALAVLTFFDTPYNYDVLKANSAYVAKPYRWANFDHDWATARKIVAWWIDLKDPTKYKGWQLTAMFEFVNYVAAWTPDPSAYLAWVVGMYVADTSAVPLMQAALRNPYSYEVLNERAGTVRPPAGETEFDVLWRAAGAFSDAALNAMASASVMEALKGPVRTLAGWVGGDVTPSRRPRVADMHPSVGVEFVEWINAGAPEHHKNGRSYCDIWRAAFST